MIKYKPYTYRIFHKPTQQYYYGSKTSNHNNNIANPDLFWKKYFTSSKYVKDLIEEYGIASFEIQRIKVFQSKEKTIEWEAKFLQRIDAAHRDNWLNRHNGDRIFTPKKYFTKEHIKKLKNAHLGQRAWNKGITMSAEFKAKRDIQIITEEHRENMSLAHKGIPLSESHRFSLSESRKGSKWYTNGIINKKIFKNMAVPKGFYLGRLPNKKNRLSFQNKA